MPSFELTILGGTGGPSENSTQSFMLRPYNHNGPESICIDGGVGLGSIAKMLSDDSSLNNVESLYHNKFESPLKYIDSRLYNNVTKQFPQSMKIQSNANISKNAMEIYKNIQEYYITHPHMDHISGMVINSPAVYDSSITSQKSIYGLEFTTEALEKFIFNDIIWPKLTDKTLEKLSLRTLLDGQVFTCPTFTEISIIPFPVYHGTKVEDPQSIVSSTIYVITNKVTKDTIVVCGDLERDHKNPNDLKLLKNVWSFLVDNIPLQHLKALIIECSNSLATDEKKLFGHLSSYHLIDELKCLKEKYNKPEGLNDLNIIISHVKMIYAKEDPRLTIINELRELVAPEKGFENVSFSIALDGFTFTI